MGKKKGKGKKSTSESSDTPASTSGQQQQQSPQQQQQQPPRASGGPSPQQQQPRQQQQSPQQQQQQPPQQQPPRASGGPSPQQQQPRQQQQFPQQQPPRASGGPPPQQQQGGPQRPDNGDQQWQQPHGQGDEPFQGRGGRGSRGRGGGVGRGHGRGDGGGRSDQYQDRGGTGRGQYQGPAPGPQYIVPQGGQPVWMGPPQQQQMASPGFQQRPMSPPQWMPPPGLQQRPSPPGMPPPGVQQRPSPPGMPPPGLQQRTSPPGPPAQTAWGQQQPQTPQAAQTQQHQQPRQQQQQPRQPQQQPQQPQQQQQQPRQQQQRVGPGPQQQPQQTTPPSVKAPGSYSPPSGDGNALERKTPVVPGTKGRKIKVESNHLQLNLGKLEKAVHYDVSITPDTPKAMLRDVIRLFGQEHFPGRFPAYDGRKNLYSPRMLPFGDSITDSVSIVGENGKPRGFKVEIKFARHVDLRPLHDMMARVATSQDALNVLDAVLRNAPANTCITAGRSFFTPPRQGQIIPLGQGMEMYYGFFQSAIRGWKQTLLNVDVAHKAFPQEMPLINLICDLGTDFRTNMTPDMLKRGMTDYLQRDVEKFLRMLKIKYEISGQPSSKKIYRVNGFGDSASKARFKQENQEMTVEQYFKNLKRVNLQFPNLPTLWVGSKERESKILLPLEFCTLIGGQVVNRKMTENQTSAMIKMSATNTEKRKQKIMDGLQKADHNRDPCIKEFGFSVGDKFETMEARVLDPPTLEYANNQTIKPQKGVWRSDRVQFFTSAVIKKWTVASATRYPPREMDKLAGEMFKYAPQSGVQMTGKAQPPFTSIGGRQSQQDVTQFFVKNRDFDLIFVVVPNSGPQYSFVKKAAEINVGCLTQCIKERTLQRLNAQTVINILLKVNSKMNGTNHGFAKMSRPPIMERPCMIMGADVTHPSPDARDIPSVAAVTASHDPKAFKYNICWRLQPPRTEIIEDLCDITAEQLMYFYRMTGQKPERIVFFRDGVSEGQFTQVQHAEIKAIRQACKKVQSEGFEPSITFLVVQKRHHTRLFPTNPRDSEDRNMNVPAGTCVDTHIVNPTQQNFYLVSHASIQGVAKPTKYCTLWDDNDMSNDEIEQLTYHLCHMFTRCNRSVSYPAPTYYAHLAAARAKVYIENDKLDMEKLKELQMKNYTIRECIRKDKPMFFV